MFIFFWLLYQWLWCSYGYLDRSFKYFLDLHENILRYQRIPILRDLHAILVLREDLRISRVNFNLKNGRRDLFGVESEPLVIEMYLQEVLHLKELGVCCR